MNSSDKNDKENLKEITDNKIKKMRLFLSDSEHCREIARKLCQYISSSSK